jgi:hypothetical protein
MRCGECGDRHPPAGLRLSSSAQVMVYVYLALYIHSLYMQLYIHVYTYLLSQIHVSRILKPLPPREFTAKRPAERSSEAGGESSS